MKKIAGVIAISVLLSGCIPVIVTGAAITGKTVAEDRRVGTKVDDNVIALKIRESMLQYDAELLSYVSVAVHEGRVLITGNVKESAKKSAVEDMAWKVSGVKEVINEIEMGEVTLKDIANDAWITNALRSKALVDSDIRSANYVFQAECGKLYILGVARSQAEMDKLIDVARHIKGVRKVVSHIVLKDDSRRP